MSSLQRRIDEIRVAISLLTRLPTGRIDGPAPTLAEASWAYPLVGLPVGLLGWLAHDVSSALGFPPGISALAAVAAAALVTGGLHHDGLADFADGMFGGRDRASRLDIMRDSRIGTYGVLALVLVLACMALAIADLAVTTSFGTASVLIAVASRYAMFIALAWLPPARPDGLGQLAHGAALGRWWPGAALGGIAALSVGSPALLALLAMAAVSLGICLWARRKIGGQTGDVLGAVQLTSEAAGWLALT